MESQTLDMQEVRDALINLYLGVKFRRAEELAKCSEESLKDEVAKLQDTDLVVLIDCIKNSVEALANVKEDDSKEEASLINDKSISGVQKGYNEMLQNLENEVRMHIRVIHPNQE
eukprot:TRINITY_DN8524_c0_g1_i5.p1 TRINITY_DN8524_c0_g1~~TRINITY_DN8524_c0_g1_i5.p1  ORF type:complete len:115 (+),score=36.28 TRINITY_DN8524_c0_g1_i5:176-520(+)